VKGTLYRAADNLAREHTERAIKTIANVMNDWCAEDRDRIAAANALLDRGHGKPVNSIIQVPANRQMQRQLAALSDEEIEAQIMAAPLPRLALQVYTDVEPEHDPLLD
jgi:HEAT repeat protein